MVRLLAAALLAVALGACTDDTVPADAYPLTPVSGHLDRLRDDYGRYVFLNGINTSGGDKVPASIDADGVPSYVGKPFPLDQADRHFATLQQMGFNSIRLLVMWEGLQPTGPDEVDAAYVAYLRGIVQAAGRHGVRVLLEMHQDVFSRFLLARYNQHPAEGAPGSLENTLMALVPPYDDVVSGNGAPRWVVEACLPERDLSSPGWGVPRLVSGLTSGDITDFVNAYRELTGSDEGLPSDQWLAAFQARLPGPFPVNGTTDLLPLSTWGGAAALSLDVARCYGAFFAGSALFPGMTRGGKDVQAYLQDAYVLAWSTLAREVSDLPNVLGYDVFNEPNGNFLVLAAVAAAVKLGAIDGAKDLLESALGLLQGDRLFGLLTAFRILPPDTHPDTLHAWGLDTMDLGTALSLNYGFDETWLRPFYERAGAAILAQDPDAVIFIEPALSITTVFASLGSVGGGSFEKPMTAPNLPLADHVVYAPHWYTDMYPFPSFVRTPRDFTVEEQRYKDYQPSIERVMLPAKVNLGNMPAVFAEFGMFFDFGGIEAARASGYAVTAVMLNDYFEALERMNVSRMMWDYNPENSFLWGDLWNHEDLSIIDPTGAWRAEEGWQRPHPNALAGKPVSMHYWSDLHYFDPDKGKVDPAGEFQLTYASKETDAPTEIYVPERQYPDGFYVWLSDGRCAYDPALQTLYHYPEDDRPGVQYTVTVRRPLPADPALGWRYFFQGDRVLER